LECTQNLEGALNDMINKGEKFAFIGNNRLELSHSGSPKADMVFGDLAKKAGAKEGSVVNIGSASNIKDMVTSEVAGTVKGLISEMSPLRMTEDFNKAVAEYEKNPPKNKISKTPITGGALQTHQEYALVGLPELYRIEKGKTIQGDFNIDEVKKTVKTQGLKGFEGLENVKSIQDLYYNYPKMDYKEGQVTLPNTILSFSPFWFNELYLPNVKIVPIGNDYFYNPLAETARTTDNSSVAQSILVISSDVFGKDLSDFILELEKEGQLKEVLIYFKLHPNQFFEKEYYIEKLRSIKNIRIITNEQSVGGLLKICSTVFAIQSTAIYEALQANRKVILLKRMSYLRHGHIFDRKNLHLVDTVEDFISALNTEILTDPNVAFFAPFDKESFFEAL